MAWGVTRRENLWEMPIRYRIEDSVSDAASESIEEALDWLSANTPIRFDLIYNTEEITDQFWLEFHGHDNRTFAAVVGKPMYAPKYNLGYRAVKIWLAPKVKRRHVLHELCHILGLYHEHQRPDRDQNVRIKQWYFSSRSQSAIGVMQLGKRDALLTRYDPSSITHYWNLGTFKVVNPDIDPYPIIHPEVLSPLDLDGLARMYNWLDWDRTTFPEDSQELSSPPRIDEEAEPRETVDLGDVQSTSDAETVELSPIVGAPEADFTIDLEPMEHGKFTKPVYEGDARYFFTCEVKNVTPKPIRIEIRGKLREGGTDGDV